MKKAILVWGPEATATRLLTRLCVEGGAIGDGEHVQRWEREPPTDQTPIVWRKSLPYWEDHRWPDLAAQVEYLRHQGYDLHVLVTSRDYHATIHSQVRRGHVKTLQEAADNYRRAYREIFQVIAESGIRDWEIVSVESFVIPPRQFIPVLRERLGLNPEKPQERFYNLNYPYYGDSL